MHGWALAVMLLANGGAQPPLALSAGNGVDLAGRLGALSLVTGVPDEPEAPPACFVDVCQPRVAVPGFEPRFDARSKRTDLAAVALERLDAGMVARVARSIATTGLRLDYAPPQADPAGPGRGGFGRLNVFVRWRLDAWLGPVWAVRRAP